MWYWWLVGVVTSVVGLSSPGYRLPDALVPSHYLLDIITHLDSPDFYFTGKVWIKVQCTKPTNTIILHSNKLNISEEEVTVKEVVNDEDAVSVAVVQQRYVPENEFYLIKVDQSLKPGRDYVIHIAYWGLLTEGLAGYYRSSYFDKQANATKWMAVTQFQSTDARRAFPCFDEPAMKARFTINLGRRQQLKTASNMRIIKTEPIEGMKGWVWDRYEDTVPMSTYLVAFLVSDLEYRVSDRLANNVTFRIWARKDAIDQVEFAREIGPKILEYYEQYFDVKYPLPKQDMAAIPDFSAGAMENWGLITYRETVLLFDKHSSSSVNRHSIASVIAHELAHQWFGNLVTMTWWTDLWLNEGFATYVAAIGVEHEFPEWNSLESTNLDNTMLVFGLDALKSSHPVSTKIGNPSEIGQIFDTISYKKGAALLRMMNLFLGEATFRKGVSNYLKEHRFNNAEQDDLWSSLTEQGHKDNTLDQEVTIKEIMDTWTLQTGYPLVTVIRDYENGTARVTQGRYLQIQPDKKEAQNESCWWVPLSYTSQAEPRFNITRPNTWLNCADNRSITIQGLPSRDHWVIFNINGAGVYRVQYDDRNWELITKTLNSEHYRSIGAMNRAHLVMNALDSAWRGDMEYPAAMAIVSYLKREKEFLPWKAGLSCLNNIDRMLRRTPVYGDFKRFVGDLVAPAFGQFGKITDVPKKFEDVKHHVAITNWACKYNIGGCRQQAQKVFDKWMNHNDPEHNNPIPSDMKSIIYCNAVRQGGEDVWNYMWQRYKNSNVGNEKNTILNALGCSRDVWILNRYLDWSIDENSGIRKQDSLTVFSSVIRQEVGFYVGRDFLQERVKEILKFHGQGNRRLGRYMTLFADHIISEEEKNEWINFITENKELLKYSRLASEQSAETAAANAAWSQKFYSAISKSLAF